MALADAKPQQDAPHTTGGSSGGDAAALASGMTPLGLGNDYGGSLRVPSQFCGTAAIRPTLGRVAQHASLAPAEAVESALGRLTPIDPVTA